MRFDEVLRTFAEFFDREGIRWAVIGGLADGAYGDPRHDMKVMFAADTKSRDRVINFANAIVTDVPTSIVFVAADSPLLAAMQYQYVAGVAMRIAPSSAPPATRTDSDVVDFGPATFSFQKCLEALTLLTAGKPGSREISGPSEPFTL